MREIGQAGEPRHALRDEPSVHAQESRTRRLKEWWLARAGVVEVHRTWRCCGFYKHFLFSGAYIYVLI